MSDIIDRANERAEEDLARAISAARNSNGLQAAATGHCLWCAEPLADGQRWCNSECRDDWQRRDAHV